MHIKQVDHVKLLGAFFYFISYNQNNVIAVMNQQLYLLNQLRKQELDIRGLTQIFMGLVIAHFQYAPPAIAGQISVNELSRIDADFAKALR